MAGENQKASKKASDEIAESAERYKQTLKDIIKDQQDLSGVLRDVLKEITKTQDAYTKIEARVDRITKGTLDLKGIQNELNKLEESVTISKRKQREFEMAAGKAATDRLGILKQEAAQAVEICKAQGVSRTLEEETLRLLEEQEDHTLTQLFLAEKNVELANRRVAATKEVLQEEQQVSKNIGISGFLAGKFAEKLGIGETFYKKITLAARDSNKELTLSQKASLLWSSATDTLKEKWKTLKNDPSAAAAAIIGGWSGVGAALSKAGNYAKDAANGLGNFMSMTGDQVIGKVTSGVAGLVKNIPLVGGLLGGLVEGFGKLLELSLAEDDKIVKLGRDLGVSKGEAEKINENFLKIANNSGKTSISAAALVASQRELSQELGVTNVLDGQILKTNIELSKLAGLDAKTRASIAQSSIITGKTSESITKSVLGQVGALKAATGISFDYKKVLSEASGFSGALGLQFAKYPEKLSQSLVSVKSMGLELQKLDSMADQFLSFEQSISKEFEAQLLTGKDINLTKAREAFLNNDLATAAKEITRQVGSSSDYLKMNRIQQQSFAEAMGMSRDDLADMLKKQEAFSKLGAKDLKDAQSKVEALKAQGKSRAEIVKMVGEEAYQNITNASAQEKIAGFLEKIQSAVGSFLARSPIVQIIDKAMAFLDKPETITKIVQKIQGVFATLFDIMGSVAAGIMKLANRFGGADIDEGLIEQVGSGGDFIRSMDLSSVGVGDNAAKTTTGTTGGSQNDASNSMRSSKQSTSIQVTFEGDVQAKMISRKGDQSVNIDMNKTQ